MSGCLYCGDGVSTRQLGHLSPYCETCGDILERIRELKGVLVDRKRLAAGREDHAQALAAEMWAVARGVS